MRCKRRVRCIRCREKPVGEIAHEGRDFRWRRKRVLAGLGADIASKIGIAPGNIRTRALHHQAVKIAHVALGQRAALLPRQLPHIADGIVMIECFHVILEGFAANGHTLLNH